MTSSKTEPEAPDTWPREPWPELAGPLSGASLGLGDAAQAQPELASDRLHALATAQDQRYVDGGLVGRGGMGEIRAVHDARLDRTVALKLPVAGDEVAVAQLIGEAAFASALWTPEPSTSSPVTVTTRRRSRRRMLETPRA